MVRVFSDLHLEFGDFVIPEMPNDSETTLILAGDIHVGHSATNFINPLLNRFAHVIYIMGNHEYYHQDIKNVSEFWKSSMQYHKTLHVLNPGVFIQDNLRVIGATLWTSTNDPEVSMFLNDYACIYYKEEVLTPQDTRDFHLADRAFIVKELEKPFEGTTIVVTHHAPVETCVHPKYEGNIMNKCFHSHLDYIIAEHDIDMWIHGHMHDSVEVTQDNTLIYANPRGYQGFEENNKFETNRVFEF